MKGRHIVLGAGNLGRDLAEELQKAGLEVTVFGRDKVNFIGVDSDPISMRDLAGMRPDVVWNTVGAGGPGGSPLAHFNSHVALPMALAEFAPRLICFSTAYLNDDPEGRMSAYALSKSLMERALETRANVRCIRVGSLYGSHQPMRTLVGKIVAAAMAGKLTQAAMNKITPTPTKWLAKQLVEMRAWDLFDTIQPGINLAPSGWCPVREWVELIAHLVQPEPGKPLRLFLDETYPADASAGRQINPDWYVLWLEYGQAVIDAALKAATQ